MQLRTIIVFGLVGLLSACSKEVNIPSDKYGVLLRFGEVVGHVAGPAAMGKQIFVESVVLLDKKNEIVINGTRYAYVITDPAEYYKRFGLGEERLEIHIANNILKRSQTRQHIEELIETESLPINLLP